MDKINKLSNAVILSDQGINEQESKFPEKKDGIISDLLGIQSATIDKMLSTTTDATNILGINGKENENE